MKTTVFLPKASGTLKQKLDRLITISLQPKVIEPRQGPFWGADFFGVEESDYWRHLHPAQQKYFLMTMSEHLVKEAIYIEHAGIVYAQRMGVFATTQEERHYYATIAQEELQHLHWLRNFYCSSEEVFEAPSFSQLVAELVLTEDRPTAVLLVQIMLEGWGLQYYAELAQKTTDTELRGVFENILHDESRHHAGGIILLKELSYNLPDVSLVQSVINTIRIGPFLVARTLAQMHHMRSSQDIVNLLQTLNAEKSTLQKSNMMKKLLSKILSEDDIQRFSWEPLKDSFVAQEILESLNVAKEIEV